MMKFEDILVMANSLGLSKQPTDFDEHYYVFWNVDWNTYPVYGCDCVRFSFYEDKGMVQKITITKYDSMFGYQNTTITETTNLDDLKIYL